MKQFGEKGLIDYESLVHSALRRVIKNVLEQAAAAGLPGDHHFYICFVTSHPRVQLPDYLHEDYPEDMTIIIQYEYWDLNVQDDGFFITLCFDENHERIFIPFDAVVSFVDPSVKFGVQFNPVYPDSVYEEPTLSMEAPASEQEEQNLNNIVSIDFSKKR